MPSLAGKRILLVISGGIAAYKSLDLIRRMRERGAEVRCVLTRSGAEFVTPLSVAALSENKVYEELFSLTDEAEMGHIRLSREADLVVVAPATANLIAKHAQGLADDLATTLLLATDKPVLMAPAMNVRMWDHAATKANLDTLNARGVQQVGPNEGPMACGEFGLGRMAETEEIIAAIESRFSIGRTLAGRRALVTSGPTLEPIDPVRYIANRSSGRQGHAIAAALAQLGAETLLVSGPTELPNPDAVSVVKVESAQEMLAACEAGLPVDVAVCAAAVCDWRIATQHDEKLKKDGNRPPNLKLAINPDILATLSQAGDRRPSLMVGFAAETERVVEHAQEKRARKGCDWILANDVSPNEGVFGGEDNLIHLIDGKTVETWPRLPKSEVATRLAARIAARLSEPIGPMSEARP